MAPSPTKTVLLASPPLVSGVSLLGNVLLSLGIRVEPPLLPGEKEYWVEQSDGSHEISGDALKHYTSHFSVLNNKTNFHFDHYWKALMEHRFNMVNNLHHAVILFVRDPIDSSYSWYKRYYGKTHTFKDYLSRLFIPIMHLPFVIHGTPLLIYAMFAAYWLSSESVPVKIVRFEDMKQRPGEVVREVLEFLGIERSDAEIDAAVGASDVSQLRENLLASGRSGQGARRGAIFEWREHMSAEEWDAYTAPEPIRSICQMLGYRTDDTPADVLTSPDPYFAEYVNAVEQHLVRCIERRQSSPLVSTAAEAISQITFELPDAVIPANGLMVDPRLLDGYRGTAAALILMLASCPYINREEKNGAQQTSFIGFHERFRGLANLFYRCQDNPGMARMTMALLANVKSMDGALEWSKIVGANPKIHHLVDVEVPAF